MNRIQALCVIVLLSVISVTLSIELRHMNKTLDRIAEKKP